MSITTVTALLIWYFVAVFIAYRIGKNEGRIQGEHNLLAKTVVFLTEKILKDIEEANGEETEE